jgi:CRP-like cAMP-binding protein
MSLSLIKELWSKTKNPDKLTIPLNEDQDQNIIFNNQNNSLISEDYKLISDYFSQKFPEVRDIFSKFNSEDYYKFIINSNFNEYSEKELIFAKNAKCDSYLFILYGDIDFFDNKEEGNENILIKTISAGKVYGHLVKESYKYNLIARSNISLIEINKKIFDELIININKIKNGNKFKFIKKFFPKIRIFSDDIINSVLQYFDRVRFKLHSKIILKDEYNEYIYLIIKGQVGLCLRPKVLFNFNNLNNDKTNILNNDYIILEHLSKGEVFGINSALKGQKNFYTVITLSEDVEVYRIVKGNLLFYFGGSNGILPVNLKALGDLQDESCRIKIEYLKNLDINRNDEVDSLNNNYGLIFGDNEKIMKNKKIKKNENYFIIDEDSIKNNLFEAWKSCENLGNKISEFKSKLLGGKTVNKKNIFEDEKDLKEKNSSSSSLKDFSSLKGDATNRVVSRKLNMGLNMNQLKSLDKLNMYSGAKKSGEESIKKLADINSKLEGGAKNKLMSFMKGDNDSNSLEEFSKKANEKDNKDNNGNEKDKSEKPKRVKNSLRKLRGLDI